MIGTHLAVTVVLLCCLAVPSDAAAYLDPGTGSAVIQLVVAGVMGGLFVIKMYWHKLTSFFSGSAAADASVTETAADEARETSEALITDDERE